MSMTTLAYQVSFNTPAFLGNAEQQAQWRTPPFKALLRQWWRVVKAPHPEVGYDYHKLLKLENDLFGSAGDDGNGRRSKVQLRLSGWEEGKATVANGTPISHPEVNARPGANLYLGYGPLDGRASRYAIAPGKPPLEFKLRFPAPFEAELRQAMQLAHWFGTVGSRARNGWGSVQFAGEGVAPIQKLRESLTANYQSVLRGTQACLARNWPHAIGIDSSAVPCIWQIDNLAGWEQVMLELAKIKVAVRTAPFFKFQGGGPGGHATPQNRHVLSYPAGNNHSVTPWGRDARLANQMRFKAHRRADGKFTALIVHLPCALPEPLAQRGVRIPDQASIWAEVHRLLDAQKSNGLIRLSGAK